MINHSILTTSPLCGVVRGTADPLCPVKAEPTWPASALVPQHLEDSAFHPASPKAKPIPHGKLGTVYFYEDLRRRGKVFPSHTTLQPLSQPLLHGVVFPPKFSSLKLLGLTLPPAPHNHRLHLSLSFRMFPNHSPCPPPANPTIHFP